MYTATGRGRRRADVDSIGRRGVWYDACHRSRKKLSQILHAAVDVTTDVVGVVRLHRRRSHRVSLQNQVTEPRRKSFDPVLNSLGGISGEAMRDVTVCPARAFPFGRTSWIKNALLGDECEGALRKFSLIGEPLRKRDFIVGSAKMYRTSTATFRCFPRDRSVKRPIDLEHPRTITVLFELLAVSIRKFVPRDL